MRNLATMHWKPPDGNRLLKTACWKPQLANGKPGSAN
jgi:hypothetical protein